MSNSSMTGFALVGCGLVGPAHARSLRELDNAELKIVCSRTAEKARAFAEEFGCDWTTDYADVLARDDVTIVDITTPQDTHQNLAIAAAKAGRHVIVEKPLDITVARAQETIAACREADVKLGVIFQNRWRKSMALLKECVDRGDLGKLLLGDVYVKWFRPQSYYDSGAWRGTWEHEGGGAIVNQSSHSIDLLQWLMGPVESLYANFITSSLHNIEVDDLGVANLKFKSGALGVIEGATALKPGLPDRIEIHGEKGTVIVEGGAIKLWQVEGMDEDEMKTQAEEPVGSGASDPMAFPIAWHKAQLADMIAAVRDNRAPAIDGKEGLKALTIIEAIYRSGKSGEVVRL